MNWQLFVAVRYLIARKKVRFISLIGMISVAGVAVGVAALIIVMGVMTGFDEDLKEKIVGTYSHIEITSDYGIDPSAQIAEKIMDAGNVIGVSFFLNGQALIRKSDSVMGAIVKGVDIEKELNVTRLREYLKSGTLDLKCGGAIIGSELAHKMRLKPGDKFSLASSACVDGRDFMVSGTFSSGRYDYDMNMIYVDIASAQELFSAKGLVSGAAAKIDNVRDVNDVKRSLQASLGAPYTVRSWTDLDKNLLEALKLEKTVMFVILALIVMVACFNIASGLIMTVLDKTKDIGILKAVGASSADVMVIFALQGGITGIVETSLGSVAGIAACWALKTFKFINLPRDVYYIDKLPVKMEITDILLIVVSSILISLLSAIYPAAQASKLDPVEALRCE